uniref:Uncharacterized protein n=1 Tax=Amphimedon queenslandica TaxID=400682 RepID=A0A1X7TM66_AMPQE
NHRETPQAASPGPTFFCELINSDVVLKQNHAYYHQVQVQLYVAADICKWCDFCVYTPQRISLQRILPNITWEKEHIEELEVFFSKNMLSAEL